LSDLDGTLFNEMTIPDDRLKAWATQGAVDASKQSHEAIRSALESHSWPWQYHYEVYLQGSYRNSTNIRGDSDVDIVAELESSFSPNLSMLDPAQTIAFHAAYSDATYGWREFRQHVLEALTDVFGSSSIYDGPKAITVFGSSGRLDADVLACQQRRHYGQFISTASQSHVDGVRFWDRIGQRWIDNFPKLHYGNGVVKNDETHTKHWFKPTVRMFKNARTYLIDREDIAADLAPSYFLECLLFNVPDVEYGGSCSLSFHDCLHWLETADFSGFMCQNGVLPLFGPTPEQWDEARAKKLVEELVFLWDYWY
jgi:hypothetical protein